MALLDTLYDLLSGVVGAASGALVTAMVNRRKNKSLTDEVIIGRRALDNLRVEHGKLLETIERREEQILDMEKQIEHMKSLHRKKRRK